MNCAADIFTRDFFAGVRVEEEGGVKQTSLQMCCLTEKKTDFLFIQQISYQATDFLLIQQISFSFNRFSIKQQISYSFIQHFLPNNRYVTVNDIAITTPNTPLPCHFSTSNLSKLTTSCI